MGGGVSSPPIALLLHKHIKPLHCCVIPVFQNFTVCRMKILEGEKGRVQRGSATEEIGGWESVNRKGEREGKGGGGRERGRYRPIDKRRGNTES